MDGRMKDSQAPQPPLVDVEISKISKKGNGVGSYITENGVERIVEVPFSIPGDKARVRLMRKRGGVYAGLLQEIVGASSDRIQPRCIHFGICGGCRWQQVPYALQLRWKESVVRQQLAPYLPNDLLLRPIIPCEPPWQYRNKMEFSFSSDLAKHHFLGLIMDSSNGKVLNLSECHLVNPWFMDVLQAARRWWENSSVDAYHPPHNTGALRTLTVREGQRTGDRLVMLTVSGNPLYALSRPLVDSFVEAMKAAAEPVEGEGRLVIFLRIHQIIKGQPTQFYEMLLHGPDHIREKLCVDIGGDMAPCEMTFAISPAAFFQPNTRQAERIYSAALQMAQLSKEDVVYDLYCGTGILGICAAQVAKEVIGIELSPESSLDARTNAANMGITNITILTGDVGEELEKLKGESRAKPNLVMVDPPRVGLDDRALRHLLELKAEKILYVSCNPATQAANIGRLVAEGGYQVAGVQPIDQFPHTIHLENIVLLTQKRESPITVVASS
jgi:23S rRNA (uracil1939-C5)-methyltransferase